MAKAVDEAAVHSKVLDDKPIELYGLKLWGIPMRQYEEWAACKNVWLTRQSTFPVSYISMPFLDAIFAIDTDAVKTTGKPQGLLYMIMYTIGMSMRLGEDCVRDGDIYLDFNEDETALKAIVVQQDGTEVRITPSQFKRLRQVIAWAQGDKLPDEALNDDLLETERFLSERNAPSLNYSLLDMKASVALACGVRIRDVSEWTILEFETMRRAIDRSKQHMICALGENEGCKWESGNPAPSWCFDKIFKGSRALIAQSQFGKKK